MNRHELREALNSPVPLNIVYWSFLGLMAVYVNPAVLLIMLLLPCFVSSDRVTITHGETTVEIEADGEHLSERTIRRAVEEAKNE